MSKLHTTPNIPKILQEPPAAQQNLEDAKHFAENSWQKELDALHSPCCDRTSVSANSAWDWLLTMRLL